MAVATNGVKSWVLDKYAKQIDVESGDGVESNTSEPLNPKGGGQWKVN